MTKFWTLSVFLLFSLQVLALEDGQVRYSGGTAPGVTSGVIGRLDTTAESSLIFEHERNKLAIPYSSIESHEYSKEVARHLGVLPAIAVALFNTRQYRHYFRISYRDQSNTEQVAIFEVSKRDSRALQAVLDSRSPRVLKPPL